MKGMLLSLVLLFITSKVFCQHFMNGAGLTIMAGVSKGGNVSVGEGLTYSPRFNFVETESLSVSAGIPLSVGISSSFSTNYSSYSGYANDVSIGFILNAPLLISLNIGRGSTKNNQKKFGYFVGAGFGYHHGDFLTTGTDDVGNDYTTTESTNAFGPAANGGVRLGVGRRHRNIELRLSYMQAVNAGNPSIFGLATLFNF
jgi:hypothetical protein